MVDRNPDVRGEIARFYGSLLFADTAKRKTRCWSCGGWIRKGERRMGHKSRLGEPRQYANGAKQFADIRYIHADCVIDALAGPTVRHCPCGNIAPCDAAPSPDSLLGKNLVKPRPRFMGFDDARIPWTGMSKTTPLCAECAQTRYGKCVGCRVLVRNRNLSPIIGSTGQEFNAGDLACNHCTSSRGWITLRSKREMERYAAKEQYDLSKIRDLLGQGTLNL